MRQFKTIQDVEEWLEPMDYAEFWVAIMPYGLTLEPREHCDQFIAEGEVDEETVLGNMKYFAKREMRTKFDLDWRIDVPEMLLH